jgi:hypothetical protein
MDQPNGDGNDDFELMGPDSLPTLRRGAVNEAEVHPLDSGGDWDGVSCLHSQILKFVEEASNKKTTRYRDTTIV